MSLVEEIQGLLIDEYNINKVNYDLLNDFGKGNRAGRIYAYEKMLSKIEKLEAKYKSIQICYNCVNFDKEGCAFDKYIHDELIYSCNNWKGVLNEV